MITITPRTFNFLRLFDTFAIDYIFSQSTRLPVSQNFYLSQAYEDLNPNLNSHVQEPCTPLSLLHLIPLETPSPILSQDSWNSLVSPAYSINHSPSSLTSEPHPQSLHRAHSRSWTSLHSSASSPISPPMTSLNLEPGEPELPDSEIPIPRSREPKIARPNSALKALKFLSKAKMSVTDLI